MKFLPFLNHDAKRCCLSLLFHKWHSEELGDSRLRIDRIARFQSPLTGNNLVLGCYQLLWVQTAREREVQYMYNIFLPFLVIKVTLILSYGRWRLGGRSGWTGATDNWSSKWYVKYFTSRARTRAKVLSFAGDQRTAVDFCLLKTALEIVF